MFAFTLAEVLITLVIIGVIAAITVPSLINKTNNQETVSKLKKAYSTMAQATNKIILKEGPVQSWATSLDKVYDLYKNELINAKECKQQGGGCFSQNITLLNSNKETWTETSYYEFVLQDGTQLLLSSASSTCTINNPNTDGSTDHCIRIYVDINGNKKPNTVGRDIFLFVVKKNGLYPAGCDIDGLCTKNFSGRACACKVLRESAMNY